MKKTKSNNNLFVQVCQKIILVGVPIIIAELILLFGPQYSPAVTSAISSATHQTAESFTELYFTEHLDLPKVIRAEEEYNFLFTIHNVEHRTMNYQYVIYIERGSSKTVLNQGQVHLLENQAITVKESFGPLKNERAKVAVELLNTHQRIDFWMEKDTN